MLKSSHRYITKRAEKSCSTLCAILASVLWFANVNNVQCDSDIQLINFSRIFLIFPLIIELLPLIWKYGHLISLIGFGFSVLKLTSTKKKNRSFVSSLCLLIWIFLATLHSIDLKGRTAIILGLYKEDLYIALLVGSSFLCLFTWASIILPYRRKKICHCRMKKRHQKLNTSLNSQISSARSHSFSSSRCGGSSNSSTPVVKSNLGKKSGTLIDDNSPSRILGSQFSGLSLQRDEMDSSVNGKLGTGSEKNSIFSSISTFSNFDRPPSASGTELYRRNILYNHNQKSSSILAPSRFTNVKANPTFSKKDQLFDDVTSDLFTTMPQYKNPTPSSASLYFSDRNSCFDYAASSARSDCLFTTKSNNYYSNSQIGCKVPTGFPDDDTVSLLSGLSSSRNSTIRKMTPDILPGKITKTEKLKNVNLLKCLLILLLIFSIGLNVYVFCYVLGK